MSAPFDHRLVLERLRTELPAKFNLGTAADLAAVTSLRDFRPPQVFVVLAQETPIPRQPGSAGGAGRQIAVVHFGVTLAVTNHRDNRGAAAGDDLQALLGQVRDALIGWTPALPAARDCQLIQGKVIDYDTNVLVWADIYQTQHAIGRAP
ncbi:phage tail terminator protein [Zestomonas carbonaria]|uniref:Gp37 protein n=1 Tax=Zestomonas carbonaria TaxID=2762745 RepID=A0A7U7ELN4_9GAMM|nr:hypothetical protein [Pseudomonas carbonaria]CAD5107235.1 hypothetical protein PSEWESI4_01506 [Pseudomonas carbonaria]